MLRRSGIEWEWEREGGGGGGEWQWEWIRLVMVVVKVVESREWGNISPKVPASASIFHLHRFQMSACNLAEKLANCQHLYSYHKLTICLLKRRWYNEGHAMLFPEPRSQLAVAPPPPPLRLAFGLTLLDWLFFIPLYLFSLSALCNQFSSMMP